MKATAKKIAGRVLPEQLFTTILSIRARNYERALLEKQGLLEISRELTARFGFQVLYGPFQGMTYTPEAIHSRHGAPKLLGAFERELHPIMNSVQPGQYERMIDVGSAEGYYAVGLALRARAEVHAFDCEPRERSLCKRMARANHVEDRVLLDAWCTPKTLRRLGNCRCFIISDCEGFEVDLFDDETVGALWRADLVIELHDRPGHSAASAILHRFRDTHEATLISAGARDATLYRELGFLGADAGKAIWEYRNPSQQWVHLRAKALLG